MPICKCGRETNEPDGVCVICKLDNGNPELRKAVKEIMKKRDSGHASDSGAGSKAKFCKKCGEAIEKPTSNRQQYHPECQRERKKERDKVFQREYKARKKNPTKSQNNSKITPAIPRNPTESQTADNRRKTQITVINGNSKLIEILILKRDEFRKKVDSLDMAIKVLEEEHA